MQRKSRLRVLPALLTAGLVAAAPAAGAQGTWTKTYSSYGSSTPEQVEDTCSWLGIEVSYAEASASSNGYSCSAEGYGWEEVPFCDVTVQTVAVATWHERWTYTGGGTGTASLEGSVHMEAELILENADCAGAALGFTEFKSNLTEPIVATLTDSAAETDEGSLGKVSASAYGVGLSVPVTVGYGEGEYPDEDDDAVFAEEETDFVYRKHRSRAFIKLWSNGVFSD